MKDMFWKGIEDSGMAGLKQGTIKDPKSILPGGQPEKHPKFEIPIQFNSARIFILQNTRALVFTAAYESSPY